MENGNMDTTNNLNAGSTLLVATINMALAYASKHYDILKSWMGIAAMVVSISVGIVTFIVKLEEYKKIRRARRNEKNTENNDNNATC